MGFYWTLWGVPGTLMLVASWIAAVVAFRTAPGRAINQRLALVLLVSGAYIGMNAGTLFFLRDHDAVLAMAITGTALNAALPWLYLAFLGASLDTRLVRPFRSRRAFGVLALLAIACGAVVIALPHRFVSPLYHPGWAPWNFQRVEWGLYVNNLDGVVGLFGLIAAVSAYLRTVPCCAARQRAKWFAIAFGMRDAYVSVFVTLYPVLRPIEFWGDFLYNPGQSIFYLLFLTGLVYGVLSTQLLDIKLRVRFAIEQSTVAAAIGVAFLVISELIESFSPVHGVVESLIIAVLIVVALRPLQRFAYRFAGRLMRGVSNTPTYLEARRLEVYASAVEGAMEDGLITEKEAAILARLREQLQLTDDEVTVAEAKVLQLAGMRS